MGRKRTRFTQVPDDRQFLSVIMYSRERKRYLVVYEENDQLKNTWEQVCSIPPELMENYRQKCRENNETAAQQLEREDANALMQHINEAIGLADGHRPVKKTKPSTDDDPDPDPDTANPEAQESAAFPPPPVDQESVPEPQPQPDPDPEPQPQPQPQTELEPEPQPDPQREPDTVVLTKAEHEALLAKIPGEKHIVIEQKLHQEMKKALCLYRDGTKKLRARRDELKEQVEYLQNELGILPEKNEDSHHSDQETSAAKSPMSSPGSSNTPTQRASPSRPCESVPPAPITAPKLLGNIPKYAWDFYHLLDINVNAEADDVKKAITRMLMRTHPDKIVALDIDEETRADIVGLSRVVMYIKETLIENRDAYDRFLAYNEKYDLNLAHGGLNTDMKALTDLLDGRAMTYSPDQKFVAPRILLGLRPSRAFLIPRYPSLSYYSSNPNPYVYTQPVSRNASHFAGGTARPYSKTTAKPYTYKKDNLDTPGINTRHYKPPGTKGAYKIF